ncbi:S-layer homology domain-containing protein [Caldanaerovirga acetigignens]|uniref:S-layer homology domain-containing protein n=1 Tax=Caldanaerovirga acetigignens TaxID=447595 RepID=A0A1M7LI60_9FIRM|nr:S-layer homology domain-containing protein [Caldanaerovirga acetigignens]SHM77753.1 S-layer homology domain-containing protein [Caldanaerovirga acetigignens]
MKRFIAGLLIMILLVSLSAPVAQAKQSGFKDVGKEWDWARFSIEKMYAKGIVKGYPGGWFKPKNSVTHLETIIMALRIMGWEGEIDNKAKLPEYIARLKLPWKDAYYYLNLAVKKGIIKPEEIKNLRPNEPVKRYEIAKYIVRAIGREDEAKQHMNEKLPFKDVKAIPDNAVGYVYLMVKLGLIKGYPGHVFQPNKPISRAEMAVIINSLDELLEEDEKKEAVFVVVLVDRDDMTITVSKEEKTATYDLKEDVPVYINGKYSDIEKIGPGDEVKLMFNEEGKVVFIQVISKKITSMAKGILVGVDERKQTVSLLTYEKVEKGYVGMLKESDIEGWHLELETKYERFVLVGDTSRLENYVGEKVVILGEIKEGASIYMRGPLLEVDEWFVVTDNNTLTYEVTGETYIEIGERQAELSDLKEGSYVELGAQKDKVISIKVIK